MNRVGADVVLRVLHRDRLDGRRDKRTYLERVAALPDGCMVQLDGAAWLVQPDSLVRWSLGGYGERRSRVAAARVSVLTPRSAVAALRVGYRPALAQIPA